MTDYKNIADILKIVLTVIGDVSISEGIKWAEVKANAEALRAEGHENDAPTGELPEPPE